MIQVIMGLKGSGKTKHLIEMVNAAQDKTSGCVVCIEKGSKLIHEINNKTRLVDISEYAIETAEQLYGFVCGVLASNYDLTDLFIDSAPDGASANISPIHVGFFANISICLICRG